MFVSFGSASGSMPPLDLDLLRSKSLFVTRPSISSYMANRSSLVQAAEEVFALIHSGVISARISNRYPLRHAAQAHRDLENRSTMGSLILEPNH
jgi:NADPH:quinone reductase